MFGAGDDFPGTGRNIDFAYRLSENEWNGTTDRRSEDRRCATRSGRFEFEFRRPGMKE